MTVWIVTFEQYDDYDVYIFSSEAQARAAIAATRYPNASEWMIRPYKLDVAIDKFA